MDLFKRREKAEQGTYKSKYCAMKFEHIETLKRHAKKAHGDKSDDTPNVNPFGGF
jgi:hypothetical protein